MPISSGFGSHQTNHSIRKRIVPPPQIISRAPKFRENSQNRTQNGVTSKLQVVRDNKVFVHRPTAVTKQAARSDTFTLSTKLDKNNSKVAKVNQMQNGSRRQVVKEHARINSPPLAEQKRTQIMRKTGNNQPMLKQTVREDDLLRPPLRFANRYDNTTHYSTASPVYYEKVIRHSEPMPQNTSDRSQHMRVGNNEYIIHRQKKSPANDYYTESPRENPRPQRVVQVVHDSPYRERDDVYYVEPEPRRIIYEQPRRQTIVTSKPPPPPPTEYVYVDELPSPSPPPISHRPRRSEVIYVENPRRLSYEEEVVYVDQRGNEIDYIYDTEPIYDRHNYTKPRQVSSKNIVYE